MFFAASYVNAEIERYYLGPILIALDLARDPRPRYVADVAARARGLGGASATDRRDRARIRRAVAVGRRLARSGLAPRPGARSTCSDRRARGCRAVERATTRAPSAGSTRAGDVLEPDAVVVSWWSYSTPLWYAQHVEGRLPDVDIVDDRTRLDEDLGSIADVIDALSRPAAGLRDPPADELAGARRAQEFVIEPVPTPHALTSRARRARRGAATRRHVPAARPARCRTSSRRTTRRPTSSGLVAEALETLPTLADTFEIIVVDDGSRDATREHRRRARRRPPGPRPRRPPPDEPRLRRGAPLRLRGRPLRPRRLHRRRPPVQVADLGRLTARLAEADRPDVVVGYRIKRADPLDPDALRARCTAWPTGSSSASRSRDVDCACKLFRREALRGPARRVRRCLLLGRAADQAAGRGRTRGRGRRAALPADGRLADRREAAVVFRAVRDFWPLRLRHVGQPRRGAAPRAPILGERPGRPD